MDLSPTPNAWTPYDGWAPDDDDDDASDCSTLRSDGHLQPSESDFDEDGLPIIEDDPTMDGQGDFTFDGEPESSDAYGDFADGSEPCAKRHKTAE